MEEEFLSIQYQKEKIELIINDKSIGLVAKILKLQEDRSLNKKIVEEYLFTKRLFIMEDLFMNPVKVKKMRPPAESANKWDQAYLDYYKISLQYVSAKEMFGEKYQEDINILPIQVRKFLKNHPPGSIRKFEKIVWRNSKAKDEDIDEYSMLICDYRRSQNYESCVNQIIQYLLQKFFKTFVVRPKLILDLWVCNELRIAKPDFTLIERGYQATLKGLLAVEDKIINSKGFPQLIAEGIAVAQQKDWNLNWPVYMIYYCGLEIKIFKAYFSQNLIDNVKNGFDCYEKTIVYCLNDEISLNQEEDLINLSYVANAIKEEIISRSN